MTKRPSKETLVDLYEIQKLSCRQIAEKLDSHRGVVERWLKLYNITTRSKDLEDLTKQKFGKWTVLERTTNSKNKLTRWRCKCDCGRIGCVTSSDLKSGNHKSCGKCHWHLFIQDSWWCEIQKQAKKRNKEFNITKDYLYDLWKKQKGKCAISGLDMNIPQAARQQRGPKCTASIDRIDNTKGYIEGNVQWVRKEVNKMRREFTVQDYIQICHAVSLFNKKENNE